MHLIVTGKKHRWTNVNIMLSHTGGSTIWLAPRAAVLSFYMVSPAHSGGHPWRFRDASLRHGASCARHHAHGCEDVREAIFCSAPTSLVCLHKP